MIPQEWRRGEVSHCELSSTVISKLESDDLDDLQNGVLMTTAPMLQDWSRGDAAPPPLPAKQPVFEPMMINTKSSLV